MDRLDLTSSPFAVNRFDRCRGPQLALEWFVAGTACIGLGVGAGAMASAGLREWAGVLPQLPVVLFFVNAAVLVGISKRWQAAIGAVRLERQYLFRVALLRAVAGALLFLALQTTAIDLVCRRIVTVSAIDGPPLMIALLTAHLLHTVVAVLFLVRVLQLAVRDRYDHEYYWGVKLCAGCWHALLIVYVPLLLFAGAVL